MGAIDLSEVPELPVAFMNADHALEVRLLNDLEDVFADHARGRGTLGAVLERLSLLAVQTRENYLREESMMRETGFPAYAAHKAEHDRVLAEMDAEARLFRDRGDAARLSKYLFEALPAWWLNHMRTMDLVTARFVAERRASSPAHGPVP